MGSLTFVVVHHGGVDPVAHAIINNKLCAGRCENVGQSMNIAEFAEFMGSRDAGLRGSVTICDTCIPRTLKTISEEPSPIWLETCDECGTESPNCVDQLCGDCYRVVFAV